MPTDAKVEVVLGLTDGTKIISVENLTDVTTFLEQHKEFVNVVRCKDCKHSKVMEGERLCGEWDEFYYEPVDENGYCYKAKRKTTALSAE